MSDTFYFSLCRTLLLILLASLLAWWCAAPGVHSLQASPLSQFRCEIDPGSHRPAFRVYLPTDYQAEALAHQLCRALTSTGYGSVVVSWQPREQVDTDTLINRRFDLIWDRQHVLEGHLAAIGDLYPVLLPMPDYQVAWFSHSNNPQLTREFLAAKRIGLLADSQSQSGHQWPLKQLTALHLPKDRNQLHFYTNRQAMMDDFIAGRLDLIPGLRIYPELSRWPGNRVLALATHIPIGNWYLNRDVSGTLHCSLIDTLRLYEPMILGLAGRSPWPISACKNATLPTITAKNRP